MSKTFKWVSNQLRNENTLTFKNSVPVYSLVSMLPNIDSFAAALFLSNKHEENSTEC